jgi:Fic family protein
MPLFTDLDRLKAELDALRPLAPEQEARVLQKFRLDWNYNSNAIEGNSLTLGETRSLLLHGLTAAGKPMRDHLDIKGHNEAVGALEDFVRSEYPLTEQFIREMHQLLLGEPYHTPAQTADGQPTRKLIVPGRYKTSPNNVLTATGEMFYFASVEETPGRMTDLVDWYRAEEAAPTLPPVALAAEFHYRFVRIHPFDDGNGRMSRLLMNLILLRHGYPMTVIKAEDRNRYLAALAEADAGEPEPFLRFIIENVEASLRLMIRAAQGEPIDEPSDLDKKLALLKKQILTNDDIIEKSWSLDVQSLFFDTFVSDWLDEFVIQTNKFDDLFLKNVLSGGVFYTGTKQPVIKENSSHSSVRDTIKRGLNKSAVLANTITFSVAWIGFRQRRKSFDLRLLVDIILLEHEFGVAVTLNELEENNFLYSEPENGTIIFDSIYNEIYKPTEYQEINYQIANKVYDFIAAKLAEADTPPA